MSAMNQQYIEDNHLVDRYVQHKLSDQERDDFEIFMLEHPEVADQVELAMAMRKELKSQSGALSDDELTRRRQASKRPFDRIWATAATLLLGASIIWNLNSGTTTSDEPALLASTVWLQGSRSGESSVAYGSTERAFPLNVDVASANDVSRFSLSLTKSDGELVWTIEEATAYEGGIIGVMAPALQSGSTYRVSVRNLATGTIVAEYELRADDLE